MQRAPPASELSDHKQLYLVFRIQSKPGFPAHSAFCWSQVFPEDVFRDGEAKRRFECDIVKNVYGVTLVHKNAMFTTFTTFKIFARRLDDENSPFHDVRHPDFWSRAVELAGSRRSLLIEVSPLPRPKPDNLRLWVYRAIECPLNGKKCLEINYRGLRDVGAASPSGSLSCLLEALRLQQVSMPQKQMYWVEKGVQLTDEILHEHIKDLCEANESAEMSILVGNGKLNLYPSARPCIYTACMQTW